MSRKDPTPEPPPPPECPSFLTGEAAEEWARITAELEELGILSRIDRSLLTLYCTAWDQFRTCSMKVQETGPVVRTKSGAVEVNPYSVAADRAARQMRQCLAQLGLTPAARKKAAKQRPADDPLAGILRIAR